MADELAPPTSAQGAAVDRFADALYEVLTKRARSWGVVDVGLEVDGWYVDVELQFATGPDMGASVHAGAGEARYCELVGADQERWFDEGVDGLAILAASSDEARDEQVMAVLDGLLAARRPLLR